MLSLEALTSTWSLVIAVLLLYFYNWYKRPKHFPPGPRGVPLLGSLPFMGKYPERIIKQWESKYGPIMSVRFGPKDMVVLNDYETIQQAYVKQASCFSDKPQLPFFKQFGEGFGLAFLNYDDFWKTQRKFGVVTLREMGVGKRSLEDQVNEEAAYLNSGIRAENGKPFNINDLLHSAVSNVICRVTFSNRFDYDDKEFKSILKQMINQSEDILSSVCFVLFIFAPILMHVPPFSFVNNKIKKYNEKTAMWTRDNIKESEETFDEHNIRNFTDAFLLETKKKTHTSFVEKQLLHFVRDLFQAGTVTTANTLYWTLLCLMHYPQSQEKLRKEIMEVVGSEGQITTQKRSEMPYTCAFMQEIFRFRTLMPFSVHHATSAEVKLGDFVLPKETVVLSNIWAVHNDKNLWEKPELFNPDRFLDENGSFMRSPYVLPFSVGPRQCMGEQLARMEFFIFLVSLVRRFEFLPDPNAEKLPDIDDGINGFGFIAKPYVIVAKEL